MVIDSINVILYSNPPSGTPSRTTRISVSSKPPMTTKAKALSTGALLVVLIGLGAADYISNNGLPAALPSTGSGSVSSAIVENPTNTDPVAKQAGVDVPSALSQLGYETQSSTDLSMLSQVVTGQPQTLVLLKNSDRVGSVTWIDSPQVKAFFISLKEGLLSAFSPNVQDLRDETLQGEGQPVRNMLTFLDPSLSEERLVFVRVRERLYEFHIASGKETEMNALIEVLTTK